MTELTEEDRLVTEREQRRLSVELDDRIETAKRARAHLWTAMVCYYVDDPATVVGRAVKLGPEMLAMYPMIGCYVCEREWSPELAAEKCRPPRTIEVRF